jgi:hypothetical protein
MLRRIFGQKRDEVTGGSRRLHNEQHRDLYSSSCIIRIIKARRMRWAGHVARMGKKRNAYRLSGKRPLARPRCRWMNSIKMDLLEIGWGGMDWIGLAQDSHKWRAVCELRDEGLGSIKFWETIEEFHSWWPLLCSIELVIILPDIIHPIFI